MIEVEYHFLKDYVTIDPSTVCPATIAPLLRRAAEFAKKNTRNIQIIVESVWLLDWYGSTATTTAEVWVCSNFSTIERYKSQYEVTFDSHDPLIINGRPFLPGNITTKLAERLQ